MAAEAVRKKVGAQPMWQPWKVRNVRIQDYAAGCGTVLLRDRLWGIGG